MKVMVVYYVTIVLSVGIPSIVGVIICPDAIGAWVGLWLTTALLFFAGAWISWDKELRDELRALWKSQ